MTDEQTQSSIVVFALVTRILETRLHQHALRSAVARVRDADDLVEPEIVEAVTDDLGGAFGGEALSPRVVQQAVADFHVARRRTILEAVPTDEGAGVAPRCMPNTESISASVMAQHTAHRGFDLFSRHR